MSKQNKSSRRKFIADTAKAGIVTAITASSAEIVLSSFVKKEAGVALLPTGFDQTPLAYAYKDLEPSIDAMTMEIHYTKHAAAYSKNLKEAAQAEAVDIKTPLEDVLAKVSKYSPKIRNNGGGHYNHELFWKSMKATGEGTASGKLLKAIEENFNSFDAFKTQFSDAAKSRFGSGWAWLVLTPDKKLKIGSTPNQDNPLMDISDLKGFPLLGLDVWEHAYYLKYQNKRADYIEQWWKVVNWNFIQTRFEQNF
ncbi:MAG: superoxide dismutase [Sphingobacteriales bacterium]|nr:MAG: superoxide dismutase [Sphingobacteriales bacterium]